LPPPRKTVAPPCEWNNAQGLRPAGYHLFECPFLRDPQRGDFHHGVAGADALRRGGGKPGADQLDQLRDGEAVGAHDRFRGASQLAASN
jgi:hypothetical protein